ncbi:MAG TPA: glycosyltransferase family 39 protein [Candidatus Binatia bacterium]|nr:glycosyltransferase family 39 protein [Candidatus Binatia bacterium]
MSRRTRLVLVLTVALAMRLGNLAVMSGLPVVEYERHWPEGDMAASWAWSSHILAGDVLCRDTPHPYTGWMERIAPRETWERWWGGRAIFHRAPLYPYTLAAFRWVGGDGFWGIALGQLAIALVSVALVVLIAERLFGGAVATVAGLAAALYGPFLLHEALLIRDPLGIACTLLALWAIVRCDDARPGGWFLAGVCFALSLLSREANMLFAPVVVLWIVRRFGRRSFGGPVRAFVAGVLLGLLPLFARNIAVGVAPWALSNGAVERVVYGHAVDAPPVGGAIPADAPAILAAADGRLGRAIRLTLATYQGDWWKLVRNEATILAALFAGFEPADNANWYYFVERSPFLRFPLRFEIVLAAGLVGIWLARRTADRHAILCWFLIAAIPGMTAGVLARYRLVAVAVLLIYAGVTVVWIVRRARAGVWGAAAVAAGATVALAIGSALLLSARFAPLRYRSAEYVLAAQVYDARGEPEKVLAELRDALVHAYRAPGQDVLSVENRKLAESFAGVAHGLGRDAESATVLERLAAEYPGDPDLQRLLTIVYREGLGRPDLAERHAAEERRLRAVN